MNFDGKTTFSCDSNSLIVSFYIFTSTTCTFITYSEKLTSTTEKGKISYLIQFYPMGQKMYLFLTSDTKLMKYNSIIYKTNSKDS